MKIPRFVQSPSARYLSVAVVCAATTLLATPLLHHVDLANIALLFVLAVVVSSSRWGRGPGIFAAFSAVACFDFFFVPPRFSFSVEQAQYLIVFFVMLVVSLVISHLTQAIRKKAIEAQRRADEASLLFELAGALSGALTLADVEARLRSITGAHFGAAAGILVPDHAGRLRPPDAAIAHLDAGERAVAQGVYTSGQATRANADLHDGVVTLLAPLDGATRRRGVLALHVVAAAPEPDDALVRGLAAVVATAIERIHFVEVAQQSALDVESERLRNSILSVLSHDLRTPLTVLYGVADAMAQRTDLPDDARTSAAGLRDQSHRMHRMVDNLLDLARLSGGRVRLRRDWESVSELAGACVRQASPWLDTRRVRIEMAPDLPLVDIDAVLFERVLCNLLENAAKYSTQGSPIELGAAVETGSPAHLAIWVDSAGAGFPPGRLAQVFDWFERGMADSRTPGIGIGLAVCRAVVEAHGGRIAAENRAEGGARILIRLPLPDAPPAMDGQSDEDAGGGGNA